ncbi:MAG: isoprenylcysteine carboxylmethyltransferase family protein [Elusimicrobia bacterium]|nr:isoprenylcysteine carboxylmethyltransferase family protein [Elusimicrobiota bacterium]
MKNKFEKVTFRTVPVYIAVIALLYFARAENMSKIFLITGAAIIALGEFFRIWGCGHLVKTKELIISGPYAHLRHPLYTGTYLITFGFCMMAGMWWLLIVSQLIYALYYYPRKEIVEGFRLAAIYGEDYFKYMRTVPALIPSLKPYAKSDKKWSFKRVVKNSEIGILLADIAGIAVLYLKFTGKI